MAEATGLRRLVLVLGDQLSLDSPALQDLDPARDRVLMIEAPGEARHVWSHKARIVLFLSAMRHFAQALAVRGVPLDYVTLDEAGPDSLPERLAAHLRVTRPAVLRLLEPGEWRLARAIEGVAAEAGVALQCLDDTHFLCSRADFARWARTQRGSLRMETFYRMQRRRLGVLIDDAGEPEGGQWNFDADNRKAYPKAGPGAIPPARAFEPDALTREVIALVEAQLPDHPGALDSFAWPVTREQALQALERFVEARLARFGPYQDAMWRDTPWGWHSLLSSSLNLHLLDPREVIRAVEDAWRARRGAMRDDAERAQLLASVEGFIRQILGWREFIRGVYWLDMPGMAEANHFEHQRPLPDWYWSGDTRMACLRDAIGQTLAHGYAHHIQRLMVTGLYALLAEIDPRAVADWYLAVYVDAVEWAELPNVAGMALYADGGRFTTKPYVASGAYIQRQSNHCGDCGYDPKRRTGDDACPFTVLYWHFLAKHERELAANPRTALMVKNLARLTAEEREGVTRDAERILMNPQGL
jgi:deoxyribodipyrimidine photolyase-related protein